MSSIKVTEDLLVACLLEATELGSKAANEKVNELAKKEVPEGKLLDACGGSTLKLSVDGRTKVGRLLYQLSVDGIRVSKAYSGGYSVRLPYTISIVPPVNGQEQSIHYAADSAAAKYIEDRLGIEAYASSYDS